MCAQRRLLLPSLVAPTAPHLISPRTHLAHSSRGWTGARTPSSIKNVRQSARRRAINQPRRTAAKTLVTKAIVEAGNGNTDEAREALARAISALDRAAKSGAIHRNAADRRKSRLTMKVAAALGGEALIATSKATRTTGKAAAAKQAKVRIAAAKASKSKGAQTSVGKAREALARTTRGAAGAEGTAEQPTITRGAAARAATRQPKTAVKSSGGAKPAAKSAAAKSSAKSTAKAPKASPAKTASKSAKATAAKAPNASAKKKG
jgi:ribosomal protein S20